METINTVAAVVSAVVAVVSWFRATSAIQLSAANRQELVQLQQQFADYSKKPRGGAGGQGGAGGSITIGEGVKVGTIHNQGGAGGKGGEARS